MSDVPAHEAHAPLVATLRRQNAELEAQLAALQQQNAELAAKVREAGAGSHETIFGLSDLLVALDAHGRLAYLNTAAEKHFGVSRQQALGQPLTVLRSAHLGGELLLELAKEARSSGSSVAREVVGKGEDGVVAWSVRATSSPTGVQLLISDRSELRRLEATLARYISPTVMEEVLRAGVDPFQARKYELSVLFADLRGFTSMSSRMPAEQVKTLIDQYLEVQIDVVLSSGAMLDKIVGDEVMAVFGAPLQREDHAIWAVNTAMKMREGHAALMERWRANGVEGCALGIGISAGEVVVGNIGSSKRMDYTVLGHNVNLGARLCSAAQGGEILISMRTFELVREALTKDPAACTRPVKFRRGEAVVAKGIAEPVETVVVAEA